MANHRSTDLDRSDNAADLDRPANTPLLQSNFKTTSTGSMELVGLRERKPARVSEFESQFRQPEERSSAVDVVKEAVREYWTKFSCKKTVVSSLPIVQALGRYSVLRDLPSDVIAGLTSGIMMIPQGLAFASLSTLPPIIGLYISLFSSLTYAVLGTGQQTSFGCIAILSIMMGSILDKYESSLRQMASGAGSCDPSISASKVTTVASSLMNATTTTAASLLSTTVSNSSSDSDNGTLIGDGTVGDPMLADLVEKKLQVAGAVTLLCGLIFIVLGKIGFGKVTVFMSDSLVTGVTVGAAFHVGSSQLKTMFGLTFLPRYNGMFKLMKLWFNILINIHHSNVASLIAAAICILIIYLVKKFVNEKYKDKLRVPVPIELVVMILATVVSYFANLNERFQISIVKDVPVGVPTPSFPDLSLGVDYLVDGLIIIIVAFAQSVSVSKLMGLKHNYSVDSNQEMFALGLVNVVCAVFSGYICGASVSRTVVQDSAGGRTQIASLFAAGLVLLVMLFIGPYFYYVPKIALSAIIIVSLQSLILKLLTIPEMWRKSKGDCLVFVLTVLAVVVLDADIGLLVGVVVSIFIILFQSMMSSVDVTARIAVDGTGFWRSADKYYSGQEQAGIKVVRINFPLYFVNAEIATNDIFSKTGLDPLKAEKSKEVKAPSCSVGQKKSENKVDTKCNGDKSKGESAEKVAVDSDAAHTVDVEKGSSSVDSYQPEKEETQKTVLSESVPVSDEAVPTSDAVRNGNTQGSDDEPSDHFSTLILDLSFVAFVDLMGVKALEFIITKYKGIGVTVYVTNVSENCLDTLRKSGFMGKHGTCVFLTVDTVLQYLKQADSDINAQNTK